MSLREEYNAYCRRIDLRNAATFNPNHWRSPVPIMKMTFDHWLKVKLGNTNKHQI